MGCGTALVTPFRTDGSVDEPALHALDAEPGGFEWLVADDTANSVFAWLRRGGEGPPLAVAVNLTPEPRAAYRIGLPAAGTWRELLNSDAQSYGGANIGNDGAAMADGGPLHGHPHSATLTLPPLGAVILRHEGA